ncbi:glutathione peroxidase [Paraburkholderia solisilvae]|uniref:Glutathione peroxidase n=1 Tax=Paraburkholderia solisilvae TaxID=624376 RepID=A0A6J5F3N9_9BURK|nr:glutathione peroxidase [Paraburkholderia solisilvae]CAB3771945.1 Hydroperoxy fatty acid reductase gpx1 [Paraburkholderia solisilvae]
MAKTSANPSVYSFSARTLNGETISLERYRGRPMLIVNTASECGFTPQYAGLQTLHQQYAARGLEVLGFPCNQFGKQEPGDAQQIGSFCERNFGVSFQLFEKIDVKGPNAHPLFRFLTHAAPGLLGFEKIKWNFTKFLVDRDGRVVKRYAPGTKPEAIVDDIEALL